MDLSRRNSGGALALLGAAFVVACGGQQKAASSTEAKPVRFVDKPQRPGKDRILVLTPFSENTFSLWNAMRDEVSEELDVVTLESTPALTTAALGARMDEVQPKCVILVGNSSARQFASLQDAREETPPSVVLMSSFASEVVAGIRNGTGIAYEVPGVTSFVRLRKLYERPVRRVGVIYRGTFGAFIDEQRGLAKLEEVELVGRAIDGTLAPRRVRLALKELLQGEHIDALWVINDNALLTPALLRGAWLPELRGYRLPVVVGVSSLVNSELNFGSVAVVPDHEALGVQAANLLFELLDEEWEIGDRSVELPLSVKTVVDMTQKEQLKMRPDAADFVDRPVT
jgi:hypothetical protein